MLRTFVRSARWVLAVSLCCVFVLSIACRDAGAQPFTIQQALSAPYSTDLTPAPTPGAGLFAWVEDAEGRHNLWIGGVDRPARRLTHNTEDDAQDISALAWSPDSQAIAYTYGASSGADGKPANPAHLQRATPVTVLVQPLAEGAAPISFGEGHAPLFSPDGHTLLFVRAGQIWVADVNAPASAHQLVFDRGSAGSLVLSASGKLLAFISTRREGGITHSFLALYDMAHKTLRFPGASTGNDLSPTFVDGDFCLAWIRTPFTEPAQYAPNRVSPNPWSIQLLQLEPDYDSKTDYPDDFQWPVRTLYAPAPNAPGSVLPHMATGDPRLFFPNIHTLVFSSEADGWNHLYALEWSTKNKQPGAPKLLTPGPYEIEDPTIFSSEMVIYYAANSPDADPLDADRRQLYRLNFQPDAPFPYLKPQRLTSGADIFTHPHTAAPFVAALASSVHEPMHPVLVARDGSVHPLRPNALPAGYPGAHFVTPRQVILRASDRLHVHAQIFIPPAPAPAGARRPALVFVHGGPHRQMLLGFPSMDYYSNAYAMNQYLASRGFLVLSVNYRCGIGYGLNFRQCLHAGADGASEYKDVLAAAHYLRARADVDPRRIGIWGGSYGGYLTGLALARNSDLFAAGVDFHGVHERRPDTNEPPLEAEGWLAPSPAAQQRWRALAHQSSPMASLARWRSPILLIHGDNDPEVPYHQTPMLADALRARGLPMEELIFPDEVHGFLLHRDWISAYQATAEFFERTLHPER